MLTLIADTAIQYRLFARTARRSPSLTIQQQSEKADWSGQYSKILSALLSTPQAALAQAHLVVGGHQRSQETAMARSPMRRTNAYSIRRTIGT